MFQTIPQAIGLDVSDNSVKMALLKRKGRGLGLESFVSASLPSGLVHNGEITDSEKLATHIRQALEKTDGKKIKTKYVISSLPEEKSFVRVIPLPPMSSSEINQTLQWEIEAHIPLKYSEIFLAWQPIAKYQKTSKNIYILAAAAPQILATKYLQTLDAAGLIPLGLEIESVSIVRALMEKNKVHAPTPILDFGLNRTLFLLYSGKSLCFSASIPLGSRHLTQAISEKMSLDLTTAENLKIKVGLDSKKGKRVLQSCQPILDQIIVEAQKYIGFFKHQCPLDYTPSPNIERILLSGGGSQLFGLAKYLSVGLKTPVELANPWVNILKPPLKSVPKLSFNDSLGFSTCLGLALAALENTI